MHESAADEMHLLRFGAFRFAHAPYNVAQAYDAIPSIRTRVYICRWPVRRRKFLRRRIF